MPSTFLEERTPPAPAPLAEWLREVLLCTGPTPEVLLGAGLAELDAARSAPGRVRESAFHLLAADALLTYACEAALEAADPGATFVTIAREAAAPGR